MKISSAKSWNRLICENFHLENKPLFGALVTQTLANIGQIISRMTNTISIRNYIAFLLLFANLTCTIHFGLALVSESVSVDF